MTDEEIPKKVEGEQKKETTQDKEDEKIQDDVVEKSKNFIEQMNQANKVKSDLLEREEKLQERKEALLALGGNSKKEAPQKPEEETPAEYSKRIMAGDGKYGEE